MTKLIEFTNTYSNFIKKSVILALITLPHPLTFSVRGAGDGEGAVVLAIATNDSTTTASDSTITLGQAQVMGRRTTKSIRSAGGTVMWGEELMRQMPRIAGNADPIHYSQTLPGVQTNGEYRGGINVQGCDNAHTVVSIGGVPIYNANHLMGIFSTFNPSHYPTMTLTKCVNTARHPSRLGARLDMQIPIAYPDSMQRFSGTLECGLISSQGTLRFQCNDKTQLILSGRGSYLNILYGSLLKVDGNIVEYSFADANMTLTHRRGHHLFSLDSYFGTDVANVGTARVLADFHCRWGNNMQALHWYTDGPLCTSTTLSHSAYNNILYLDINGDNIQLSSSIDDLTLQTDLVWQRWHAGAQLTYYNIQEQHTMVSNTYLLESPTSPRKHAGLFSCYADYTLPLLAERMNLNLGLRPTLYTAHDRSLYVAPDPHVSLHWRKGRYDCTVGWALRHQYLQFAGVTDMGLPTEFWMGTCSSRPPQWAQGFNITSGVWLLGRKWRIEADAHYKKLHCQQEYVGSMLDYMTGDFTPDRLLRASSGKNYGASLMLSHPIGPLIGWIAYTYTRATRGSDFIESTTGKFPASHERPHEFNAVITYAMRQHWQFSSTAVVASGTPFTAPRHFYILGSSVISQYGEHNANRLPSYIRLDLSATYKWHQSRRMQQAVNVSVYNATAHKNTLFYAICIHKSDKSYHYKPSAFIASVLPSVSYSIHF